MAAEKPIPKFDLTDGGDLPIWVQLRDRFSYLISSGYYEPGDQLPSVRKVASEARISYNTVSKAFMSLEREGQIVTKHGSGAYVSDISSKGMDELESVTEEYVNTCLEKGMALGEITQLVARIVRRMAEDE